MEFSTNKNVEEKNRKILFLDMDNIIMLTRSKRKTEIHLVDEVVIETTEPLKTLEKQLDRRGFFKTHKGYIINLKMLESVYRDSKATYEVNLANTRVIALATAENVNKLKQMFEKNIEV